MDQADSTTPATQIRIVLGQVNLGIADLGCQSLLVAVDSRQSLLVAVDSHQRWVHKASPAAGLAFVLL